MRRSLLARLLGLSLVVALCSIAATAWLTTRSTSEQLRGEYERTLEADSFLYQQLLSYAETHDSWDDVGSHIDSLAEQVGRRVALTTTDGDVIADSDTPPFSRGAAALPATPTAKIDAASPNTVVAGAAGDTGTSTLDDWQLPDAEIAERVQLARRATHCMQVDLDPEAEVVVDNSGAIRVFTHGPRPGGDPTTTGDRAATTTTALVQMGPTTSCVPGTIYVATEAAVERSEAENELIGACLDEADVSYRLVSRPTGLDQVVPDRMSEEIAQTWEECLRTAQAEALERFVAEPAILYTETADRFDMLSGDGTWRTVLTALAILAVAAAVTMLVGRRLARPVRTLITAVLRMAAGDRSARVPISGYDDVARLGRAFNEMAESIEAGERQHRAMVSDVAHELRTPLANVRGYLEAAEDGVVPVDPDLVRLLLDESATLQRLVDDLQDLALADAGKLRLHPEECDLSELARQVVAGHRARDGETGIALTLNAPTPVMVVGDSVRLRQAIGNLVANAMQYTPGEGAVVVSVTADGDHAVVSVSDTGTGIAAEHLPHLFDRFFRAEGSRSRATGGSGLGLAVTRHLIEAHGGSIDVATEVGDGSTFTLRLPATASSPLITG